MPASPYFPWAGDNAPDPGGRLAEAGGTAGDRASSNKPEDYDNHRVGFTNAPGGGYSLGGADRARDISQADNLHGYGAFSNESIGGYEGGANDLASHLSQQGAGYQSRKGEQINNPYNNADRFDNMAARSLQSDALTKLQDAANGNAPSQASIQQQQGLSQSLSAQIAAANSARGGGSNIALANRNAAAMGSQAQGQLIGQQAAMRAQEMAQARGAYSNAADSFRNANQNAYGQDNQFAFQQAGLNAAQRAQNDQMQQGYDAQGVGVLQGQLGANMQKYGADRGVQVANQQSAAQTQNGAISAGAGTLAAIAAMSSDVRGKVVDAPASAGAGAPSSLAHAMSMRSPGSAAADGFLDSLHPSAYRYKDPGMEPTAMPTGGHYLGVMAQDVERGPTGSTLVKNTPAGKVVDLAPALSATMGGLGRLHERQRELEAEMAMHRGGGRGGVTQ